MSSLKVPSDFPKILRAFTREVLRSQPSNIYEFAAEYFQGKIHLNPSSDMSASEFLEHIRSPMGLPQSIFEVVKSIDKLDLPEFRRLHIFSHIYLEKDPDHTANLQFLQQAAPSILALIPESLPTPSLLHGHTQKEFQNIILSSMPQPYSFSSLCSFLSTSSLKFSSSEQRFLSAALCNSSDANSVAASLFPLLSSAYSCGAITLPSSSASFYNILGKIPLDNKVYSFEQISEILIGLDLPISIRQWHVVLSHLRVDVFDPQSYQSIVIEDQFSNIASILTSITNLIEEDDSFRCCISLQEYYSIIEDIHSRLGDFASLRDFLACIVDHDHLLPTNAVKCLFSLSEPSSKGVCIVKLKDTECWQTLALLDRTSL
ncbi:hypothetical protein RCL1_003780 [Eukaryota sp. TZLM3-RCL]